jgi:hypothetical protein
VHIPAAGSVLVAKRPPAALLLSRREQPAQHPDTQLLLMRPTRRNVARRTEKIISPKLVDQTPLSR